MAVTCFLPGRAKDLSAPRYYVFRLIFWGHLKVAVFKIPYVLGTRVMLMMVVVVVVIVLVIYTLLSE